MKMNLKWTEGMALQAEAEGNTVLMDAKAPLGQGAALTPKELVVAGLGGCTAMDVVALLKKHKQNYESINVELDVPVTKSGYPSVFTSALLTFIVTGPVDRNILIEAVTLSQTKYCGVSAMLVKAFPIKYKIQLNGEQIGEGEAHFALSELAN